MSVETRFGSYLIYFVFCLIHRKHVKSIPGPGSLATNQSINQSINPGFLAINQSINKLITGPGSLASINQSINQSTNQSIN